MDNTIEGTIWDKDNKLLVKMGESMYDLSKAEKKTEKYPDYKCDDMAVWNRISSKGNEYRFIKFKDLDYVAFRNGDKNKDPMGNGPDWIIKKSHPIKKG
jgi:hypothetical protein